MAALDKSLGAFLVGTYANSILYTLEILAVIQYYSASKHNWVTLPINVVVYFTFVVDTVSTLATYASVYLYTVSHWGDVRYLHGQHWPGIVWLVTSGISATIVQCFLIHRFWRISKNNYVTFALILSMLAALGGSVGTTVSHLVFTSRAQQKKVALSSTIWFSTGAATDILIAAALVWQFSQIESPFKATQSLIHKLMMSTIRTGTATSVFMIAILICFLADQRSHVPTAMAFCLGRIYALSMFYNLNDRSSSACGSNDVRIGETSNTINTVDVYVQSTATKFSNPSMKDEGPL